MCVSAPKETKKTAENPNSVDTAKIVDKRNQHVSSPNFRGKVGSKKNWQITKQAAPRRSSASASEQYFNLKGKTNHTVSHPS